MRRLVAGLVGAVVAGTVATVVRRWRSLRAVAPELRTSSLLVPLAVNNRMALRAFRRLYDAPTPLVPGVEAETRTVGTTAVVIHTYQRPDRPRPSGALLWLHAGGIIMGHPGVDNDLCSGLADELGLLVVGVDYRLAPEHPFPAALEDIETALCWVHAQAGALGVDPARIAVGGASAGGGLAAALCQRAHDAGGPDIAFQLLEYPMLDDRTALRRRHHGRGRVGWGPSSNRYAWTCYLGHRPRREEPRPHAVPARRTDLSGLPPAWIGVGALDLLHDESVDYARRLDAAGVPCELYVEPRMYHGADVALADTVDSMRAFRARMVDALRRGLSLPA